MRTCIALTLLAASPALRAIDLDGNGLSDVYEFIYFHGSADPTADPDGDGFNNLQEMIWGTNPTDPNSYPAATSARIEGTDLVLEWPTAEGKWYRVQYSDDLETWTTAVEGHVYTYREPLASSGTTSGLRFWRVQVFAVTPDSQGHGFDDWEEALWLKTYGKSLSESDIDGDGLRDAQEFLTGHDPAKKDHPAVGLIVFTPLEK